MSSNSIIPRLWVILIVMLKLFLAAGCGVPLAPARAPIARSPLVADVAVGNFASVIPIEPGPGGVPVVAVAMPHGREWFVLDTGADVTLLSPATAKQMHLDIKPIQVKGIDAAGNTKMSHGVVLLQNMDVGGVEFRDFYAVVADIGKTSDASHHIAGVAGLPMFGDVLMTIDYQHNELRLQHGSLPPANGQDIFPILWRDGSMYVLMKIGDREIPMLVDTGYSGTLMLPARMRRSLAGATQTLTTVQTSYFYGSSACDVVMLHDDLQIGRHSIHEPVAALSDQPIAAIGTRYLCSFMITIDQKNSRIRFANPSSSGPVVVPSYREQRNFAKLVEQMRESLRNDQPRAMKSPVQKTPPDEVPAGDDLRL